MCACVCGCNDRHLGGPSDNDFYGAMHGNVTYHMGPGYDPPQLHW